MDVIGKIYKDYFIDNYIEDGSSHHLRNYELGGIFNIIKKEFLINPTINLKNFKFQIVLNENLESKIKSIETSIPFSSIFTNDIVPSSIIFENEGKRSSYVFDDNLININQKKINSKSACIFYADKIYSRSFEKYEQIYLDTAGNSSEDLYKLSKNKSFKKNTIISISQEYLTKNLLDNFLSEEKYIIISHCPDNTVVYFNNKEVSIPNQFYIKTKEIAKNKRFTGLGDIFFLIISALNYYQKIPIEEAIKEAQKIIANYLGSNL